MAYVLDGSPHIATWEKIEYDLSFTMNQHVLFDKSLGILKQLIEDEADEKMKQAGVNTDEIKQRMFVK